MIEMIENEVKSWMYVYSSMFPAVLYCLVLNLIYSAYAYREISYYISIRVLFTSHVVFSRTEAALE